MLVVEVVMLVVPDVLDTLIVDVSYVPTFLVVNDVPKNEGAYGGEIDTVCEIGVLPPAFVAVIVSGYDPDVVGLPPVKEYVVEPIDSLSPGGTEPLVLLTEVAVDAVSVLVP